MRRQAVAILARLAQSVINNLLLNDEMKQDGRKKKRIKKGEKNHQNVFIFFYFGAICDGATNFK